MIMYDEQYSGKIHFGTGVAHALFSTFMNCGAALATPNPHPPPTPVPASLECKDVYSQGSRLLN